MKKYILTLTALTLVAVLSGCGETQKTEPPATVLDIMETTEPTAAVSVSPEQKLLFSVTEAEQTDYVKEELGEGSNAFIIYSGLSEVNINLDGADIPLAEAIRVGKLTTPELFAFARMDAQNGFCGESYTSKRGLTHFTYTYPECELYLAYDVYETPDGKQTLIDEIYVFNITDGVGNISHFYVDEESEWGYALDREDWGITFETVSVSPTQITVRYTQQGGQQLGDLSIVEYSVYSMEGFGESVLNGYLGTSLQETGELSIPLPRDSSGGVTLDWSNIAGILEPGEYYLRITVIDCYEKSEVHPLIVKYHDRQSYCVPFTVE